MHPVGQHPPPPPPQNRSSPSPSLAVCPSPSPSLIQKAQQHVLYGPITTIQPCTAGLHPQCVYTGIQRSSGLSGAPLPSQVPVRQTKCTKWQPKNKPTRGNQHQPAHSHQPLQQASQFCQHVPQQHVQQVLPYVPKPLLFFDQCPTNQSTPGAPPPCTSFLLTSSNFGNVPYAPGDPYSSASGLALIPQPYFKPPDIPQAFCLLPERPQPLQHLQHPLHTGHNQGPFYNISSSNSCSLQSVNTKSLYQPDGGHYANLANFGTGQTNASQMPLTATQGFQNPSVTLTLGQVLTKDRSIGVENQRPPCLKDCTISGGSKGEPSLSHRADSVEWTAHTARESSNAFEVPECNPSTSSMPVQGSRLCASVSRSQEEGFSDESAGSFDFTIEAEKMVSALCNTASSNDFAKEDNRSGNDNSRTFGGAAGDNVSSTWFSDFCTEYGVSVGQNCRSAGTQTQQNREEPHQHPELMRKTIYWSCNEAESVLNSKNYRSSSRAGWLDNISTATKTAVTKSSTCFPIFAGDRIFVEDLIKAQLRISNGWLVLDNYLNKQHYPSLTEKLDKQLINRFQSWEIATNDLLKELVRTFVKIEEKNALNDSENVEDVSRQENYFSYSFPGDVNLYTNLDLFESTSQRPSENQSKSKNNGMNDRDSTYTLQYTRQSPNHSNFHSFASHPQKETKLRSKWTITENLTSSLESVKSIPDVSLAQHDLGFPSRLRMRTDSSSKINSSSRHSLNSEFFHLRNKVMESVESCSALERQRWGIKEHHDFVFGVPNASKVASTEPIFKIRTTGMENPYQRHVPTLDASISVNQSQCAGANGSLYFVSSPETALNSTYIAPGPRNKTYTEPDYTRDHNRGNGPTVSATSVSSVRPEPVYVGKSELATVPKTRMTLLSQIEGNATTSSSKDAKEMTANLSAWFANMRNASGHRTIGCSVDVRKNDNSVVAGRTSTHPQETSRSAMDLNRQLQLDGNRQLQALQNMQAIQSQPWNASNLLNNKRTTKSQHLDEYDSSEDVRVYMKPGSYNVPKKRHHRKNVRRNDNLGSSRGNNNNNVPKVHSSRSGSAVVYSSADGKSHQSSTSVSSLVITSTVQVSSTTSSTTSVIKVPFPATPIVPPPTSFPLGSSPRILRRVLSAPSRETPQDVAWKAACASAEILLEALNVKESSEACKTTESLSDDTRVSEDRSSDRTSTVQTEDTKATDQQQSQELYEASSYEASEDDSDSTCKVSPQTERKSRDVQPRTNFKTDSWLIRTFSNVSTIENVKKDDLESDSESLVEESLNSDVIGEHRERQNVATSTPEPKNAANESSGGSTVVVKNLEEAFEEIPDVESPRSCDSRERSTSSSRLTASLPQTDISNEVVSRATYSETVRRSTGKMCSSDKKDYACRTRQAKLAGSPTLRNAFFSVPRKSQRKDHDKNHQILHRSRKVSGKRLSRELEEKGSEEGLFGKKLTSEDASGGDNSRVRAAKAKQEDVASGCAESKPKAVDRGWSVWYSSRRRQTLSTLALSKLTTIYQTIWQMEGAQLLKCPPASSSAAVASTGTIEDYCKVVKSPIFLETIGYNLKVRNYHKVERVIRDFRKMINNSILYHKNDADCAKIDLLSKKLEELFMEHFAVWDFENVTDSPREDTANSPQISRHKSPRQHKSMAARSSSVARKSPTAAAKSENQCEASQ